VVLRGALVDIEEMKKKKNTHNTFFSFRFWG
jgi:hypothetical protein